MEVFSNITHNKELAELVLMLKPPAAGPLIDLANAISRYTESVVLVLLLYS